MLGRWELKVQNCVLRLEDTECYREVGAEGPEIGWVTDDDPWSRR